MFLVETSRIDVEKNGSRGQRRNRQHGQMFRQTDMLSPHCGTTLRFPQHILSHPGACARGTSPCALRAMPCISWVVLVDYCNRVSMVQCVPRRAVKREFKYAMKVLSKSRISEHSEAPSERELAKMQVGR